MIPQLQRYLFIFSVFKQICLEKSVESEKLKWDDINKKNIVD